MWNVANNVLVAWWCDDLGMADFEVDVCPRAILVRFIEDQDLVKAITTVPRRQTTFKAPRREMELRILFAARMFWRFANGIREIFV